MGNGERNGGSMGMGVNGRDWRRVGAMGVVGGMDNGEWDGEGGEWAECGGSCIIDFPHSLLP